MIDDKKNIEMIIEQLKQQVDDNKKNLNNLINNINESGTEDSEYIRNLKISMDNISTKIQGLSKILDIAYSILNKLTKADEIEIQIELLENEKKQFKELLNSTNDMTYSTKIIETEGKIKELEESKNQYINSAELLLNEI